MNAEKFRNIKPDKDSMKSVLDKISENDAEYIEKLQKLKYKKSNSRKIIQIVSSCAAALLIVAAFTLWAILGRGIRGLGETPNSETDEIKTYNVTVSAEGEIIDGKNELQGFFDDYITGKACVLKTTYMDIAADNYHDLPKGEAPPSHIETYTCNADGSAVCELDQPRGSYGIIDFAFKERRFNHMKLVLDRERDEYFAQFTDFEDNNMDIEINMRLDILENTHQNSDRVYDSAKTEAVVVADGLVTAGEKSLQDFFDSMIKGYYASADINGVTFQYRNRSDCIFIYKDGVETEFSKEFKYICPYISNNRFGMDGKATVFCSTALDAMKEMVTLNFDEIDRLGLLFSAGQIILRDANRIKEMTLNDDGRLTAELRANPPVGTDTALPEKVDYSITLNSFVSICVYENEDGGVSDVFGFRYPYDITLRAVKVSDNFVKIVSELVTKICNADILPETDAQKLVFFDLAQKYRFDYMPDFEEGDDLTVFDIKWNIYAYLGFPEEFKGEQFDAAAYELYGVTFGLDKNYNIPLETGSYNARTYMELISYDCVEREDGTKTVTAVLLRYNYEEGYDSMPQLDKAIKASGFGTNRFIRTAVGNGSIGNYGEPSDKYAVTYISKDGYTPERFISHTSYNKDSDGNWKIISRDDMPSDYYIRIELSEKVRAAFERWLSNNDDVIEFKTRDAKGGGADEENEVISSFMWYDVKVKQSVTDKWAEDENSIGDDGWIYNLTDTIVCIKGSDGEYAYVDKIDSTDIDEIRKTLAERAFVSYLKKQDGLEDYKILDVKVSDYSYDDKASQYQVWVEYSVKSEKSLSGLGHDRLAGSGAEGENKTAVCYANIINGEMVINSVGTGP